MKQRLDKQFEQMFRTDLREIHKNKFLLAVSGGVDSMVLFHLFLRLKKTENISFEVVHINHQLRDVSGIDEALVRKYCEKNEIPFRVFHWEHEELTSNVENLARKFRYEKFFEVLEKNQLACLVTAHQANDQMETMLMRLAKGDSLDAISGIKKISMQRGKTLYRPLLDFSKEEICAYAKENLLEFVEDETNFENTYTRNRIRNQVAPVLTEVNSKAALHFSETANELQELLSFARAEAEQWLQKNVSAQGEFSARAFNQENKAKKKLILRKYLEENSIHRNENNSFYVSDKSLEQIFSLLSSTKSQGEVSLPNQLTLRKTYDKVQLIRLETEELPATFWFNKGQVLYLSASECLVDDEKNIPQEFRNGTMWKLQLPQNVTFPLEIRHRNTGDRFRLSQTFSKKLRRYFIDKKIPNEVREKSWLVFEKNSKDALAVLGLASINLSKEQETDRIFSELIYCKISENEDCNCYKKQKMEGFKNELFRSIY
jgi:tRNA(Ile)-lysidine synthetase-like protein